MRTPETSAPRASARRRGERGMTLVEALCAATVLAVAVLALAHVSVTTGELHEAGREKAAAMRAIQEQFAAVEATAFDALLASFDGAGFAVAIDDAPQGALRALPGDADGLPGSIAVSAPTGAPDALLQATVTVAWQGRSGVQQVARTRMVSRVGAAP